MEGMILDPSGMGVEEKNPITEEMLETIFAFLQRGAIFQKHPYGKSGKAQTRLVCVRDAEKMSACIKYGDKRKSEKSWKSISMKRVSSIAQGKRTTSMKRTAKSVKSDMCFSVVDSGRTLDLQASNKDVRDMWVNALRVLLTQQYIQDNSEVKQATVQPEPDIKCLDALCREMENEKNSLKPDKNGEREHSTASGTSRPSRKSSRRSSVASEQPETEQETEKVEPVKKKPPQPNDQLAMIISKQLAEKLNKGKKEESTTTTTPEEEEEAGEPKKPEEEQEEPEETKEEPPKEVKLDPKEEKKRKKEEEKRRKEEEKKRKEEEKKRKKEEDKKRKEEEKLRKEEEKRKKQEAKEAAKKKKNEKPKEEAKEKPKEETKEKPPPPKEDKDEKPKDDSKLEKPESGDGPRKSVNKLDLSKFQNIQPIMQSGQWPSVKKKIKQDKEQDQDGEENSTKKDDKEEDGRGTEKKVEPSEKPKKFSLKGLGALIQTQANKNSSEKKDSPKSTNAPPPIPEEAKEEDDPPPAVSESKDLSIVHVEQKPDELHHATLGRPTGPPRRKGGKGRRPPRRKKFNPDS